MKIIDKSGRVVQRVPPPDFAGDWPFSYMEHGDTLVLPYVTGEDFRRYGRALAAMQAYSERTGVRFSTAKRGLGEKRERFLLRGSDMKVTPEETRQKLFELVIYRAGGSPRGTQGMAAAGLLHLTPWPFKFFEVGDYVEFDMATDGVLARKARGYAYTYGAGVKRSFKSRLRRGKLRIWRES